MHPGVRVMSTSLTGSQNDTGMPTLGKGVVHVHKILRGLLVSSSLDDTRKPPIVIGNRQDQQISVIGFINRPTQLAWTGIEKTIRNRSMKHPLLCIDNCFFMPLNFLIISIAAIVFLAIVCRYFPIISEPRWRVRSPFGKLPFFDGIILYGLVIMPILVLLKIWAE